MQFKDCQDEEPLFMEKCDTKVRNFHMEGPEGQAWVGSQAGWAPWWLRLLCPFLANSWKCCFPQPSWGWRPSISSRSALWEARPWPGVAPPRTVSAGGMSGHDLTPSPEKTALLCGTYLTYRGSFQPRSLLMLITTQGGRQGKH